jgi:hypothetical protein
VSGDPRTRGHLGVNGTREVIANPSGRQTLTLHLRVEWGAYHLRRSGWEGEVGEIVKRPLLTSSQYFARRDLGPHTGSVLVW